MPKKANPLIIKQAQLLRKTVNTGFPPKKKRTNDLSDDETNDLSMTTSQGTWLRHWGARSLPKILQSWSAWRDACGWNGLDEKLRRLTAEIFSARHVSKNVTTRLVYLGWRFWLLVKGNRCHCVLRSSMWPHVMYISFALFVVFNAARSI